MDIEASARKHGVSDDDMLHALRHRRQAFETDDDGTAVIHAMQARKKFLKGMEKQ